MLRQDNPFTPADTSLEARLELFAAALGDAVLAQRIENGAVIIEVPAERIRAVLERLRDGDDTAMDIFSFVTAVDYSPREPRFDVVYELYSLRHRHRCRIKVQLADTGNEDVLPQIDSVADLYLAANWHERECYDLFGIHFEGHPELRRILLPDRWDGYPLRRDYPFDGKRVWKVGCTVVDGVEADVNLGL